ncbi:hypothetical protein PR003_g5777 [Phytophthora rubi]|uniref:Secreted protein n=1 Tax=Phytophthora rubi TaxID=129364 RepID=A0A6A4FSI9_9STRA|nr:hypothetical protein PR002_g6178 [Phytophthora rubi]KAE9043566.1 hypothetical protein PR001_g5747 [Phytophthora rubi]KAE9349650.1 hypothetical protein PR003_g5777 [Phytophthora rubi]
MCGWGPFGWRAITIVLLALICNPEALPKISSTCMRCGISSGVRTKAAVSSAYPATQSSNVPAADWTNIPRAPIKPSSFR